MVDGNKGNEKDVTKGENREDKGPEFSLPMQRGEIARRGDGGGVDKKERANDAGRERLEEEEQQQQ